MNEGEKAVCKDRLLGVEICSNIMIKPHYSMFDTRSKNDVVAASKPARTKYHQKQP